MKQLKSVKKAEPNFTLKNSSPSCVSCHLFYGRILHFDTILFFIFLYLQKGERILVLKMREDGIWEGQLKNGKKGIFPFRYVKIVSSSPQDVEAWNNS